MTNLFRIQEVLAMGLIICAFDGVPIKASDVWCERWRRPYWT